MGKVAARMHTHFIQRMTMTIAKAIVKAYAITSAATSTTRAATGFLLGWTVLYPAGWGNSATSCGGSGGVIFPAGREDAALPGVAGPIWQGAGANTTTCNHNWNYPWHNHQTTTSTTPGTATRPPLLACSFELTAIEWWVKASQDEAK